MEYPFVLSSITPVSNSGLRVISKLVVNDEEYWVCGDRNNYLHVFGKSSIGSDFQRLNSFEAHNGWISCFTQIGKSKWFPEGAFVTGSHDNKIKFWNAKTLITPEQVDIKPVLTLSHSQQVCFLKATEDGKLISCGWDSICKIWSSEYDCLELQHQQYAIWAASEIPNGYVTLGADKNIRVWDLEGKLMFQQSNAHEDVLRACLYIKEKNMLVTAGNDGVIKEWEINNYNLTCMNTIPVSDKYLYSLKLYDDNAYVATSEDRCIYVVSSLTKAVSEALPLSDSVWSADVLSNGDIIGACADGMVYVFTLSQDRRCSQESEQNYLEHLESLTFSNPELQQVNILDLPYISDLDNEEKIPGRAILVRDGEKMVVCIYSSGYKRWLKIGTVTKTDGASKEKVYDEDGNQWDYYFDVQLEDGRNLPLYLNYDTNPYTAAYDFITRYELDRTYLNQIVEFIEKQRKTKTIESVSKNQQTSIFPMTTPVIYDSVNLEPVLRKLKSLNHESYYLDDNLFNIISSQSGSSEMFQIMKKCLMTWPISNSWPILELLRVHICEEGTREAIYPFDLVKIVKYIANQTLNDTQLLMLMRVIGNMFKSYSQEAINLIDIINIFNKFKEQIKTSTPRTQIAYTTAIMNYSMYLSLLPFDGKTLTLLIIDLIRSNLDNEAIYRLIYAIGNCCVYYKETLETIRSVPDIINILKNLNLNENMMPSLNALLNLIQ